MMNKINYIVAVMMAISFSSVAYAEGSVPQVVPNKQVVKKSGKDKVYSIRDEDELKITIRKLRDMKELEKARLEYNKAMVESTYYESKMESGKAMQDLRGAEKKKDSSSTEYSATPTSPSTAGLGAEAPAKKKESASMVAPKKTYGPKIDVHEASIVNFKKRIVGIDRESGEDIYLYRGDKFNGYTVESISMDSVTFKKGKKRYVRAILRGSVTDSSVPADPMSVPPSVGPFDGVMGLPTATNYPTMSGQ